MFSNSNAGEQCSQAESDSSGAQSDLKPNPSALTDSMLSPSICDGLLFSDDEVMNTDHEELSIMRIPAMSAALGPRRLPGGFYDAVRHGGRGWKAVDKHSSANLVLVKWTEPVPVPSSLWATVFFEEYASGEFKPLLDSSAGEALFTFFPKEGDVVSPRSSTSVTVERQMDRVALGPLPYRLFPEMTEESEGTRNQDHGAFSCYRQRGEKQELSIAKFEWAYSLCPVDHLSREAAQVDLAMAKFLYCRVEDTIASFKTSLSLYQNALHACPIGHIDRPGTLIQLAAVSSMQHNISNHDMEGTRCGALQHEAPELSSGESHENWAARIMFQQFSVRRVDPMRWDVPSSVEQNSRWGLTDQGPRIANVAFKEGYQRFCKADAFKQGIAFMRDLVRTTSAWDDKYPLRLSMHGAAQLHRFRCLGELRDLEDSILTLKDGVQLIPTGHPDKPGCLDNLAVSLLTRFERFGVLHDLDDAAFTHRDAVLLTPARHPNMPSYLSNLGNSLRTRFKHLGELGDLDEAISIHMDALQLTPAGHPHTPRHLNNLGNSLCTRFERLGELPDLESAISMLRRALQLTVAGHADIPSCLSTLGNSLRNRFERLRELGDLDEAIATQRNAVQLTPAGHLDKPYHLNNLGNSLRTRFERFGEPRDLNDAISIYRDALQLTSTGHPDNPRLLDSLGISLGARFERLGELGDLNDAISILRNALQLTSVRHPDRPGCLSSFAIYLCTRFLRLGELDDLDKAISTHRDAVRLTPAGHPDKPRRLNNLGNSLRTRFERLGKLPDLEDAISILRDALQFTADGHPDKPRHLNDLGNSLRNRFERLGELGDIDTAISTQKEAVQFTSTGDPHKPRRLNNLGSSLRARFERLGELRDLDDAISTQRHAVQLTPIDHPDKPRTLSDLGISLGTRFERLGELGDLDEAISTHRDAVQLTPHDHPDKSTCFNNLGSSLLTRFERLREPGDIDGAISTQRDAVQLIPDGHPNKSGCLTNLGHSLRTRFEYFKQLGDLDDAISTQRDAVRLTPADNPTRLVILNDLGNSLRIRFEGLSRLHDMEGALSAYSRAASASSGSTRTRFRASQNWILCAHHIRHHSLLRAYLTALNLLPQLAWIGLSLEHRYSELMQGADLVREAAAAALDAKLPELAVEWLERGRSIVWAEQFRLRGSYEELVSAHPDHARRLRDLSIALDHASAAREKSLSTLSLGIQRAVDREPDSLRREVDQHRTLAIERDNLLKEIRRLPGFDGFLHYKKFTQLRLSARTGPVVLLNAAKSRCDALIVLASMDHVIHVPLPNFTLNQSFYYQNVVKNLLLRALTLPTDERNAEIISCEDFSWESLLSDLWNDVAKPVLDAMNFLIPGHLSRIFWCPTGPFAFLPIHAAGLYDSEYSQPGPKVFDFVISSYVPSLAILASESPSATVEPDRDLRLLAVSQPESDWLAHLRGVPTELKHIIDVIETSPSARTSIVEPAVATVEEVLSRMKEADWVHFACHGIQAGVNSGLCLADERRLKVRDVIALSRPRGGLAFLSACQTAMGDARLPDEALHITAGMLYAGYEGVIGTMWSISDSLAPVVAKDVYKYLLRNGTRPDSREAARALHEAIARVRERGLAPFQEWVPFIHMGL